MTPAQLAGCFLDHGADGVGLVADTDVPGCTAAAAALARGARGMRECGPTRSAHNSVRDTGCEQALVAIESLAAALCEFAVTMAALQRQERELAACAGAVGRDEPGECQVRRETLRLRVHRLRTDSGRAVATLRRQARAAESALRAQN